MLYHWKEARIWGIGLPGTKTEDGRVESECVTLLPGVHDMPDEQWKKIAEHKDVQERIAAGNLQLIEDEGTKKVKKTDSGLPKSLENFNTRDAAELISGVMEVEQLEAWAKHEKRPAVEKAIKSQLKAIEYATKPKKPKGD
jgi:hypothetical protein